MAGSTKLTVRDEEAVAGGRRLRVELVDDVAVPGVLLIPAWRRPAPGAVLLHGYTSRKEQMSSTLGAALLEREIASLAVDLPLHGERGDSLQRQSVRNPVELLREWRLAIREVKLALRVLGALPEVDPEQLALVGYSMGSFLGVIVAADEPAVRAVVLAAGGDLPEPTPFSRLLRTVVDPLRAVQRLDGRPLLMVHGRRDRTITPDQAQRLFDAAEEPKELRWWDAGHHLPPEAVRDAAGWLAERLVGAPSSRPSAAGA